MQRQALLECTTVTSHAPDADTTPRGSSDDNDVGSSRRCYRNNSDNDGVSPATASFLRSTDARLAALRQCMLPHNNDDHARVTCTGQHDDNDAAVVVVASLSQFLGECRRLSAAIGSARDAARRRRARDALRAFWRTHVSSALYCCAQRGRDVGFVATHGLADSQLHAPLSSLCRACDALVVSRAVTAARDSMAALHYLTRELCWLEQQQQQRQQQRQQRQRQRSTHDDDKHDDDDDGGAAPSAAALGDFRRALTDCAVERIAFFFVQHAPTSSSVVQHDNHHNNGEEDDDDDSARNNNNNNNNNSSDKNVCASIASADDALNALEVLARVQVRDATATTQATLAEQLQQQQQQQQQPSHRSSQRLLHSSDATTTTTAQCAHLQHALLLRVWHTIAQQRRQLRFTSLVQAFALLRILLPQLLAVTTTTASSSSSHQQRQQQQRQQHRTRVFLQRLTWALARELHRRDGHFVNAYHFVKIVTTLSRLPSYTLAPPSPQPLATGATQQQQQQQQSSSMWQGDDGNDEDDGRLRRVLTSAVSSMTRSHNTVPQTTTTTTMTTATSQRRGRARATTTTMTAADFWRYVVSKACIFVPTLPLPQRRVACAALHTAILTRRGDVLVATAAAAPPSSSSSSTMATTRVLCEALTDSADDILLPLVAEMRKYDEDFATSVRLAASSSSRRAS